MENRFYSFEHEPENWNVQNGASQKKKDHFLPGDFENIRILLVEDNKVNQMLSKKILTNKGFKVDTADNGLDALEKFDLNKYDLILLDLHMPVMSGFEFIDAVRRNRSKPESQTAIIALTAYASYQEKEKALDLGVNHYLNKPCCQHELMEAIVHQLNEHKLLK